MFFLQKINPNHILARFCNFSDTDETVEFKTSFGRVTAETDLLGNELNALTDTITFKPWEIKTIKINCFLWIFSYIWFGTA